MASPALLSKARQLLRLPGQQQHSNKRRNANSNSLALRLPVQ